MGLHVLPQDTIRLIKSTQVITTPGSIAKELLENALDAGATSVTIKMENHGFSHIEVRDNGMGINEEEVKVIAKPHYTSKISSFSDLASLTTYGFRGEALASLCAVSDCCVTTKTAQDSMGHTYTFDHQGNIVNVKPAAAPNGTTVSVRNLFKNIPVRRQYYINSKRRKEEMKKVEDLVLAFSFAAPGIHLSLSHEKSCVVQKSPAHDLRGAVMNTFPTVFKDLVKREKNIEEISVKIEVYLPSPECRGNPGLTRTTADRLFILINQRPVTHKSIEKAVKRLLTQGSEGCHSRYPVGVIALTLPPDALDVNLEPNKTKMHLRDEGVILEALKEVLGTLYSPSSTSGKTSGEQRAVMEDLDTDITCTYSCITQPQGRNNSSVLSKKIVLQKDTSCDILQEEEFKLDSEDTRLKEGNEATANIQKVKKNIMKTNNAIDQHADVLPADKKIIGRTEYYKSSNDKENKKVCSVQNELVTSTQNSKAGGVYPSPSESLITHDKELEHRLEITDSDMSSITPQSFSSSHNQDISGILPLSPSLQSIQSRTEQHEVFKGPEPPVQKVSSKWSKTKNSSVPQPEQESIQLHESVIGSDGIPVYKIAPLSTSEGMFVQGVEDNREHKNNETSVQSSVLQNKQQNSEGYCSVERSYFQDKPNSLFSNKVGPKSHSGKPAEDGCVGAFVQGVEDNSEHKKNGTSVQSNALQNKQQTSEGSYLQDKRNSLFSSKDTPESHSGIPVEDGCVEGSWSRGLAVHGKNIQTVQLVTNSTVGTKPSKCQPGGVLGKRVKPEAPDENPSIPPKKTKINSLGPASFDYIHGKPVKKPSSPFILFSRNIRSQVLSEHPGADFAFIAQQMAAQWKALDLETKLHYNNLAKTESERYQEQVRKLQESRGLNTSLKMSLQKGQMTKGTLDRYVAPLTPHLDRTSSKAKNKQPLMPQRPWQDHYKQVSVTVNSIRDRLRRRQSHPVTKTTFSLIGSLAVSEGGWICLREGSITALNIYRVYERVLVYTLLNTFNLPLEILQDSIPFNASSLGLDNWNALLQLPREVCPDRSFYTVTDHRLTHSGFKVALYPGSIGYMTHGEVTHMTPAVGFIGITDLKEILNIIATSPTASLQLSRPLKIQHWIKAEAVRMIRSGPNIVKRDDVLEKMKKWRDIQQETEGGDIQVREACIHNKPILTHLYCLDDLPQSQQSHRSESPFNSTDTSLAI